MLAARIPGGVYTLFGVHVLPPVGTRQPASADGPDPDVPHISLSSLLTLPGGDKPPRRQSRRNPNTGGAETTESDKQWIRQPLPKDFPERLEGIKELSGLSWRGLAEHVGVTRSRVTGWCRGKVPKSFALLDLIRFSLGVEGGLDALFPDIAEALRRHDRGE